MNQTWMNLTHLIISEVNCIQTSNLKQNNIQIRVPYFISNTKGMRKSEVGNPS